MIFRFDAVIVLGTVTTDEGFEMSWGSCKCELSSDAYSLANGIKVFLEVFEISFIYVI